MSKRKLTPRFQNIASFFRARPPSDRDNAEESIQLQQNEQLPTETNLSDEDKSESEEVEQLDLSTKDLPPKQPIIAFPSTNGRKFSSSWYNKYEWIEYSVSKNRIYCQTCRFFASNFKQEETFTTTGFNNWKKIGDKCKKHHESNIHRLADEKRKSYYLSKKAGRIDQQLDPNFRDETLINDNKTHLMTVLDVLLFCAQQEIPLRGDDESIDSLNRGNFLELFSLLSHYNPNIKERLDRLPENAKMLSPDIQNDLLEASKQEMLQRIKQEVHAAQYYSILADEVKDVSKKELLGVSLRYLHDGTLRERAIGFVELKSMDAISIAEKLQNMLQSLTLSPENCVGQGYDGASVMAGKDGGVQALLKKSGYTFANYFHCAAHRLNLVLAKAAKVDQNVKQFFDHLDLTYSFFSGTKRHAAFIDVQRHHYPDSQPLELTKACDTRWSSRAHQVQKFLKRYGCILDTLALFEDDTNSETRLSASSLLTAIQTKKFVVLLVFFARFYEYSEFATRCLQSKTLEVSSCVNLVDELKDNVNSFDYHETLKQGLEMAENYDVNSFDTRSSSRQHRLPESLKSTILTSSVGHNKITTADDMLTLLRQIGGQISGELCSRFDNANYEIMRLVDACLPSKSNFMDAELLKYAAVYDLIIPDAEHDVFKNFIKRHEQATRFTLIDVYDVTQKDISPNMHKLLHILITIPQTSVTVERMFSSVKRIKTRLRSRMGTIRLSALSLHSIEREFSKTLNKENILDHFKKSKRRRLL